jgi:hypothetical protein
MITQGLDNFLSVVGETVLHAAKVEIMGVFSIRGKTKKKSG